MYKYVSECSRWVNRLKALIDECHPVFKTRPTDQIALDSADLMISAANGDAHGFVDRLRSYKMVNGFLVILNKMKFGHLNA